MAMFLLRFSVFFLSLCDITHAGHYLVWLPMCSKSVKVGVMEAGYELARRGHQVTVVSPFKNKKQVNGVTEIVIESAIEEFNDKMTKDMLVNENGADVDINAFIDISIDNNENAFSHPDIKNILSKGHVDVVITVPVFGNEAGYYFAHKTNATLALFFTFTASMPFSNFAVGDPYNPSYMPFIFLGYSQEMTFAQRVVNTLVTGLTLGMRNFYTLPKIHSMLARVFPDEEIPHLNDLIEDTALLINHGSPFLGDGLRPVMPKTILAGFMSCNPPSPLPEDLAKWVEEAEHGVIFVSFGSVIKSSKMPERKRQLLLNVFSKLNQRVIWKWEAAMPDAPKNVKVSSWLPQTSLLAHTNIKLFITHGGAGSIQETVCHKTPIVGVPIGMDQNVNVQEVVQKNVGVQVKWHEMTEASLQKAIEEVLTNGLYEEAVSELCSLIMDQPAHPLDRAAWWLEYLLRHPKNPAMANPAGKLYWFQYFLLDVLGLFMFIVVIILLIIRKIIRCCMAKKMKKE